MARSRRQVTPTPPLLGMIPSWELALQAAGRSPGTIRSYLDSVRGLGAFLSEHGLPGGVETIGEGEVRAFLDATSGDTSPGNAHKHFRNLRIFFNWLVAEQERTSGTPMAGVEPPEVAAHPTDPLSEPELGALLGICSGGSWVDRRDTAIIRVLMEGMRMSGLAGLRYSADGAPVNDVWLLRHTLRVTLRGGDVREAPIGSKTAAAIDRYLRSRVRHPHAASPWLWLPVRGITAGGGERRLTGTGIQQMLERRGREAGIVGRLHPLRFRRVTT